jgi:hypothetical protein
MRGIVAALATSAAPLVGCAGREPEPAVACTSYGFQPGTEARATCVQQEVASRRAARAAAAADAAAAVAVAVAVAVAAPHPAMDAFRASLTPPHMRPPVTCARNGTLPSVTCF